jgi:hypothetical protein
MKLLQRGSPEQSVSNLEIFLEINKTIIEIETKQQYLRKLITKLRGRLGISRKDFRVRNSPGEQPNADVNNQT